MLQKNPAIAILFKIFRVADLALNKAAKPLETDI